MKLLWIVSVFCIQFLVNTVILAENVDKVFNQLSPMK